jgi:tripartite-type tricarboxylate transporter receptor subunit TctC
MMSFLSLLTRFSKAAASNLAPYPRASLGQAIIIEDNGAAGSSIAHGRTSRAAPDGYTLSPGLSWPKANRPLSMRIGLVPLRRPRLRVSRLGRI